MGSKDRRLSTQGEFSFDPRKELFLRGETIEARVASAKKAGPKSEEFVATELFIKGNDASIRGDAKAAMTFFKYVNELRPNDYFVMKKYAYELIRNGELALAQKHLEEIYKNSKTADEQVALILAGVYTTRELKPEAYKLYREILANNPQSEESCLYLGRLYVADKKYREVHKLMSKCEREIPQVGVFSFFRGRMEYDRGQKKEAQKYFEQSLKKDPTYYQSALGLGGLYEEKEDFDQAVKIYKSFLKVEENAFSAPVLSRLVTILFSLERNKEVIPYAEALANHESSDLNLRVRLGLLYSDEERYTDALRVFKGILDVVPDSDKILYYMGALYQQMGKFDDSIRYYHRIDFSSPLYGDAGVQVGTILSQMARDDEGFQRSRSREKFTKYIEDRVKKNPEMALELSMLLVSYYEDNFDFKKAIGILSSLKSHKNFTDSHSYYLAAIYEKDGQYLEARKLVISLIEKDPSNAHALNFLGYSYLEKNEKMDEAYELITKAVALNPEDGYIRDSLAWYYFLVGKFDLALVEALKANDLVKGDATIAKHLGIIYKRLNHYDKAEHYLTESLNNAQLPKEREDVLKLLNDVEKLRAPASSEE